MDAYRKVYDFAEIIPVSALRSVNMDTVIESIFKYLPYGPQFYDEDTVTDQPQRQIVAEMIREKALRSLEEEIPHGIAVSIEKNDRTQKQRRQHLVISRRRSSASRILIKESSSEKADRCSAGSVHRHAVISRICSKKSQSPALGQSQERLGDSDFMIKNFGYDKKISEIRKRRFRTDISIC